MNRVSEALATVDQPPKIRLWDIQSAFVELAQARMEAEEIINAEERTQALAAVDTAIKEYVEREVRKVDGLRAILKHVLPASIASAKAERDYQARRAKSLEAAHERLMDCVKGAMIAFDKKRLDGDTGYLLLKGNGGLEPLVVDQWDDETRKWRDVSTLPDEFKVTTLKVPATMAQTLLANGAKLVCTEPDAAKIRATLSQPCEACLGKGEEADYVGLEMRCVGAPCGTCGGSGKRGVPGARLLPRNSHVEVK